MDRSALQPAYGFLGYSVLHWPQHASLAQTEFTVQSEHEQFFQDALGTWRSWLDNYNSLKRGSWSALETGLSTIHVAARWGIIPMISTLSQEKLEAKNAHGQSPLLIAAENNQLEAMRVLIESGACVSSLNNENQNVLHIVCKNCRFNDYAMIRFLLNKGVSPYVCDKDNMTPFLYAIGDRDKELAQAFLRNGFDLKIRVLRREWPGRTTISNLVPIHQLEESPVDIESRLTALHFSAMNACTDMTAFLLQWEADPNARSDSGDTPLHLGIRCQFLDRRYDDVWVTGQYSIESLKEIITDPACSEATDIYQAIDNARIQIVETLLGSKSINVNIANNQGDYPQHVINFNKSYALSILNKLVEKGADISRPNRARRTCFHLASKAGNIEVVRRFVNEGHDIMLQDADGLCPFHYAVSRGHLDILHFMSETCDNVFSEAWHSLDHFGRRPLHLLMHHRGSDEVIIDILCHFGLDPAATDLDGRTLMHHGAIHGVFIKELVEFLKCRGVLGLLTKDSIGKTPLNYAVEEANREFPKIPF
jgi:ankyrin repeat protein